MKKDISLYEAFAETAKKYERLPSILYMNKYFSFKHALKQTDKLSCALNQNVKKGDVVVVCLPNIPQTMYSIYAINKIGAICYLIHPLSTSSQIDNALKLTGSKTVFALDTAANDFFSVCQNNGAKLISCSPASELAVIKKLVYNLKNYKKLKKSNKQDEHIITFNNLLKNSNSLEINNPNCINNATKEFDCHSAAVLLCSGGTGGEPKVVELSNFAINSLCSNSLDIIGIDTLVNTNMLSALPLFHGYGLTMGLHALATHGGCNVFLPRFTRKEAVKYVRGGKINYMIGVPAIYSALLSHKKFCGKSLKNLNVAFVGGDFVPDGLLTDFNNRMIESGSKCRLFEGYGLTETSTVICLNKHSCFKVGTVGKPIKNVEIKAFKTDTAKEILGDEINKNSEEGELCVRGETVMRCYYKDEASSHSVLFKDEFGTMWIKSGDYGHVDADGFVHFKQRLKRIIKVSGVSVFPSEIEQIAMQITNVKNACCYDAPDKRKGSKVMLVIEPKTDDLIKLKAELQEAFNCKLSPESKPSDITFIKDLPLTKMNKIDINTLKEMLR